jgi:hypothetical protein
MRHLSTTLRFSVVVLREGNNSTQKFQCGQRDKQVNSGSCVNETAHNSRRQLLANGGNDRRWQNDLWPLSAPQRGH